MKAVEDDIHYKMAVLFFFSSLFLPSETLFLESGSSSSEWEDSQIYICNNNKNICHYQIFIKTI